MTFVNPLFNHVWQSTLFAAVVALVLCGADVWLAPHPVSHAHRAKLRITTHDRIGGERMPLSCLASRPHRPRGAAPASVKRRPLLSRQGAKPEGPNNPPDREPTERSRDCRDPITWEPNCTFAQQ